MGRLRRAGYEAVITDTGLAPQCGDGDWTEATGHRIATDLLGSPDRPTAIFAANDLSAVGVLAAADDLGLRVPEDLSVVGYDDSWFARLHRLSLTTINGHIAEVGQVAGPHAHRQDRRRTRHPGIRLLYPDLVRRSSTGPAPTG